MKITGMYEKIIYRDEKTAHTIFALKISKPIPEQNKFGCIICCGKVMAYPLGMPLVVEGEWEDSNFGKQLNVNM